jgi:outer membrane scaffolding protein for murein synthesis (MipA/OmpV family)
MYELNGGARAAAALIITSLVASPSTVAEPSAGAESKEQVWKIGLGGGAMYRPDYDGSDDYEIRAVPVVNITYRDFITLRGPTLMIDALPARNWSLGPLVKYDIRGREANDNPALARLPEIDKGLEAGLSARYQTEHVSLGISALRDVDDRYEGTYALFEASYTQPFSARLRAQFEVSATWADDKYMQAYFGITRAGAQASGLREFVARGGVEDAGTAVSLQYLLNEHWRVTGRLAYQTLLGDAADSPLVENVGSKQQPSALLLITYDF